MLPNHILVRIATLLAAPVLILAQRDVSDGASLSAVSQPTAQQVIEKLGLEPNIEKGYFAESFRDPVTNGNRSVSTAIYYLLEASAGRSYWHRVDASEVWHYYAGTPLSLYLSNNDGKPVRERVLGPDILRGQRPQVVVKPQEWQQARSHGSGKSWTLVGTTGTFRLTSIFFFFLPFLFFYLHDAHSHLSCPRLCPGRV